MSGRWRTAGSYTLTIASPPADESARKVAAEPEWPTSAWMLKLYDRPERTVPGAR